MRSKQLNQQEDDFVKLDVFPAPTVFVLDATLVGAVAARLRLELNVAQLQHGRHQLQHRLHLILHEAHDLHGILGRAERKRLWQYAFKVERSETPRYSGCVSTRCKSKVFTT